MWDSGVSYSISLSKPCAIQKQSLVNFSIQGLLGSPAIESAAFWVLGKKGWEPLLQAYCFYLRMGISGQIFCTKLTLLHNSFFLEAVLQAYAQMKINDIKKPPEVGSQSYSMGGLFCQDNFPFHQYDNQHHFPWPPASVKCSCTAPFTHLHFTHHLHLSPSYFSIFLPLSISPHLSQSLPTLSISLPLYPTGPVWLCGYDWIGAGQGKGRKTTRLLETVVSGKQ